MPGAGDAEPDAQVEHAAALTDIPSEPAADAVPALPEPSAPPEAASTNGDPAERSIEHPLADRSARRGLEGIAVDAGLYGVLGLPPSASDAEIQTSYRQQAARLLENGTRADIATLRRLNTAYEVLGTPVRRAEYDRARLLPPATILQGPSSAVRPDAKAGARVTRRRRPRNVVAAREAGLTEVLVVVLVVAFSGMVALLLIPRISLNLSALNTLSGVIPNSSAAPRRVIEATIAPAPARTPSAATAVPTPDPAAEADLATHFDGSTVTVSSASPAVNSPETVLVKLQRDGQPASNIEVWTTLQYRTAQERWPASGTIRTDSTGAAPITFNVGAATPGYPVDVHVFALVDGQQLSWSTTFTPH